MKFNKNSLALYVVTDRTWLNGRNLLADVQQAIEGGATFLQMREKSLEFGEFVKEATEIKRAARQRGIPFVINDNIEVALAVDADGVHIGQNDLTALEARAMIGNDKILGVSASTVEQAVKAQNDGADYIGVGAVFPTSTKKDANHINANVLSQICDAISIPVVAIGGISEENALELKGTGINGIAVISAIFAADDIKYAARRMSQLAKEITVS